MSASLTLKSSPPKACAAMLAATMAVAAWSCPALAGSATDWVKGHHSETRLIADSAKWKNQKKAMVAGVHIKLDEGWKTYWRNPGDAGLPPLFDWSGSQNLKQAKVLWPAPIRFHDSAGTSFGYKKEVVFPVLIEPETPGKPVDLKLRLEYAVCADICIPAEAELALAAGNDGFFARSYSDLLGKYLARVPLPVEPRGTAGPSVSRAEARLTGDNPQLIVDARFPGGTDGADLFIEAPDGFYLAPAEEAGRQGNNTVRFQVDLTKGDDPEELRGQTVTLTLVSDSGQAETSWQIK